MRILIRQVFQSEGAAYLMREYLIICLLTLLIVGSMIAFTQIALTYAPDNGVYALKDWAYYWWTT